MGRTLRLGRVWEGAVVAVGVSDGSLALPVHRLAPLQRRSLRSAVAFRLLFPTLQQRHLRTRWNLAPHLFIIYLRVGVFCCLSFSNTTPFFLFCYVYLLVVVGLSFTGRTVLDV